MTTIATRMLNLRTEDKELEIPIRIHAPEYESSGAWGCRYEVDWPDKKSDRVIWGFDPVQALVLALQTIGAEIHSSDYHEAGDLFLEAPGKGYGFPVMPTLRHLLQGDDVKYL